MFIIVLLISLVIFKFVFWRRLKEDFVSDQIFRISFISIGMAILFGFASYKYSPNWWFWASIAGLATGVSISAYQHKMDLIELIEASMLASISVYFSVYLYLFVSTREWSLLLLVFLPLVANFFFWVFEKHYKKLSWYRSGRVGFAGFASGGIFFLARAVIAYFNPNMLSFIPGLEVYISLTVALAHFAFLIKLSR